MVIINDGLCTGHFVPLRRLPRGLLFSWLPLENLRFGEENVLIEVASLVSNGSIVIGIGDREKQYYVVRTIDIVHAAYQADRSIRCQDRGKEAKG